MDVIVKLQARYRGAAARKYTSLLRRVKVHYANFLREKIIGRKQMLIDMEVRKRSIAAAIRLQVIAVSGFVSLRAVFGTTHARVRG